MDNDDALTSIRGSCEEYEGGDHGHGHSHGGGKEKAKKEHGHGHSHGHGDKKPKSKDKADEPMSEDMKNYIASMKKLKLVSFVSVFFIAA